jgi:hypothetical protein
MKKILLIAITAIILFPACQKGDSNCHNSDPGNIKSSNAVITGMDLTKCSCCWGWVIEIDNVIYKFDKAPAGSTVNLETLSYPATVNVSWRRAPGNCSARIELLALSQ